MSKVSSEAKDIINIILHKNANHRGENHHLSAAVLSKSGKDRIR